MRLNLRHPLLTFATFRRFLEGVRLTLGDRDRKRRAELTNCDQHGDENRPHSSHLLRDLKDERERPVEIKSIIILLP